MTTTLQRARHGNAPDRDHHKHGCLDCRRETTRAIAYGTWQPYVDAEPARQHIRDLQAAGIGWEQLAIRADLAQATVRGILYKMGGRPRTTRIRPETMAKILAVEPTLDNIADGAMIDAVGIHRRIQALMAVGWTMNKMAPHFGVIPNKVSQLLQNRLVFARTARRVIAGYEQIWDQDPEAHGVLPRYAQKSRERAEREGWPPPAAWDDDIDDPAAVPDPDGMRGPKATTEERRAEREALIEDARLLIVRGYTGEIVAGRIGVCARTIERWADERGWRRP